MLALDEGVGTCNLIYGDEIDEDLLSLGADIAVPKPLIDAFTPEVVSEAVSKVGLLE
jgi:hypothetical protein